MKNHAWAVRADCNFGNYRPETDSQARACAAMQTVSSVIVAYSDQVLDDPAGFVYNKFVYLGGAGATGKTHLQEALVNDVREHADALIYRDRLELWCDNQGSNDFVGEFSSPQVKMVDAPIVLVDDLLGDVRQAGDLARDRRIGAALVNFMVQAEMARKTVVMASRLPFDALQETMQRHDRLGILGSDFLTTRATIIDMQKPAWGMRQSAVRVYGPGDI